MSKPHIVITGGGTGGHVFPMLAVAQALSDKAEVTFIVQKGDQLSAEAFSDFGAPVLKIAAGKFRRYNGSARFKTFHPKNLARNTRDIARVSAGYFSSLRFFKKNRPDLVFSKGGYVALPVGLAAASLGIPIVTHDSDVLPGLTNRILSRWAKKLAVGFPREHYLRYPAAKLVHTGIPVRKELVKKRRSNEQSSKKPNILIVGGSLGAREINQAVLASIKQLTEIGEIIHISGSRDFSAINEVTNEWQKVGKYKLHEFVGEKYFDLLSRADVIVTRAGATSTAEAALAGVPMIVIPSVRLSGGHQLQNGIVMEESGAAIVIGEPLLQKDTSILTKRIRELLADEKQREWLVKNARSLFPDDAADKIATLLIKSAT